ncbi:DUF676-domain-containing protein [Hypoxylon trugodes]|uniref:DUF676-domain-containing protein n=1 Tax=Hypoxylon trugodes TaxID=326681 RepID=UPI00219493B0|nr:DUF676-domain-containing protein [Hypoxylon trugodes]KAI1389867.1 DUF676-domain-containing protein [Hypoxylon trugodes]
MEYNGGSLTADHLCVLVHGLWGNPNHMKNVAKQLRETHSEDKLYILVAKRNSGSFTYDGIERGGERVCLEIEEELESIRNRGGNITKISIVGYSLGGLVARYAVGLLEMRGIFREVEPINFTTFATPHLGVRTPLHGFHNHIWNVLGARTLSMSGRQLFLIDEFRDTGRPLLAALADPESIFISGLKRFKRRILYANIVNDRSVVYYTACMSRIDPYANLNRIEPNYLKGYEDVVLNPIKPISLVNKKSEPMTVSRKLNYLRNRWMFALAVFLPIGVVAFLLNAVVQTFRSSKRIRLHESGLAGIQIENYRSPIWLKELRGTVEDAYESLNNQQEEAYIRPWDNDNRYGRLESSEARILQRERRNSSSQFPTLSLALSQFTMIDELDKLGWRKYSVWIHNVRTSHAAIIVRTDSERLKEGYVVLRHWLKEEFLI